PPRCLPNREPGHLHAPALRILLVHPVVALLRRGHRHDLPRVRGVGKDLLVSGHARVEHGLTERFTLCPEGGAREHGAVFERQERGRIPHRVGFPSATVKEPRSIVNLTRPRNRCPRNAVLRAFDANGGSTVHSAAGSNTTRLAGLPGSSGPP